MKKKNNDGTNVLHLASQNNKVDVLEYLLDIALKENIALKKELINTSNIFLFDKKIEHIKNSSYVYGVKI